GHNTHPGARPRQPGDVQDPAGRHFRQQEKRAAVRLRQVASGGRQCVLRGTGARDFLRPRPAQPAARGQVGNPRLRRQGVGGEPELELLGAWHRHGAVAGPLPTNPASDTRAIADDARTPRMTAVAAFRGAEWRPDLNSPSPPAYAASAYFWTGGSTSGWRHTSSPLQLPAFPGVRHSWSPPLRPGSAPRRQ